ncbi:MAG: DUF3341 domain-containing protein [Verrucomicrobia bacterium]|nr:DUF3341 domain-containing protein [Verrucomicrobiota bacterium]
MPQTSVFCFATSRAQAGYIVDQLKAARFSSNDISALQGSAQVKHTKAPEGVVAGLGIGGALGWIAGIGVLAIPGFAGFIDASPILAALTGSAIGAILGGICGGWIGRSIQEREDRYDSSLLQDDGSILISVHAENSSEITRAEVIFAHAGGQGICTQKADEDTEDEPATEIVSYPIAPGRKGPDKG